MIVAPTESFVKKAVISSPVSPRTTTKNGIAGRLAEEMGVSLRSLYCDIDSLRAAGARIEGERGYGYWLVEDYSLPLQTFDRTEIEALALGLAPVGAG
jgi:predicted DNA-binding transcriptional regulator YafY